MDILSIIFGILLGNTHTHTQQSNTGTRISVYQEASHKEYLVWLHSLIASLGYTSPNIPKIQSRLVTRGKIIYVLHFHTYTYTSLNWVHSLWYVNGVKCVPQNIGDYLTPLALAM